MKKSAYLILAAVFCFSVPLQAQIRGRALRAAGERAAKTQTLQQRLRANAVKKLLRQETAAKQLAEEKRAQAELARQAAGKKSSSAPANTAGAAQGEAEEEPSAQTDGQESLFAPYEDFEYRPTNRQARKEPVRKIRPDKEDLARWVRTKREHITITNVSKGDMVGKIINRHHNMSSALLDVRRLEEKYGRQDFFHLFSVAYYRKEMGGMSPLFYDFLKRISLSNNDKIQALTVARMQFLFQHRNKFVTSVGPEKTVPGDWRLYWLTDQMSLQPRQFDPNRLVYSRERTMRASRPDVRMDHVDANTFVPIHGKRCPILYFPEDFRYLPNVYKRLLYNHSEGRTMTVSVDRANRLMLIYNDKRNKWIRVSRHEFADPNNIHIHLNKLQTVFIPLGNGQKHTDRVVNNISIPFKARPDKTPQELEDIFFTQTLARMAEDPTIKIEYKSLY